MRHWLACAAFALAALPLATLLRAYWLPRSCDTTYLWEGYEQVPLTQIHSRYRLIRFKDADPERREVYKKLQRLHVVPVLFVHGHLGTHQQMRSAASETGRELARRLTANASWPLWLQWYSTDFNAEASALDAALLDKQAEFVVRCIQHLLRIHSSSNRHKPFRLVLVGYSMGGMVARDVVRRLSAYAAEGFDPSYLVALVCLGSPHHFPAFVPRVLLSTVLKPAKAKEQAAASVIAAAAPRVNIMAGAGDFSLPLTHPSAATPLAPESGPQLSTLMRDMPGVWSTGSHKGIVSCNQLVRQVVPLLIDAVMVSLDGEQQHHQGVVQWQAAVQQLLHQRLTTNTAKAMHWPALALGAEFTAEHPAPCCVVASAGAAAELPEQVEATLLHRSVPPGHSLQLTWRSAQLRASGRHGLLLLVTAAPPCSHWAVQATLADGRTRQLAAVAAPLPPLLQALQLRWVPRHWGDVMQGVDWQHNATRLLYVPFAGMPAVAGGQPQPVSQVSLAIRGSGSGGTGIMAQVLDAHPLNPELQPGSQQHLPLPPPGRSTQLQAGHAAAVAVSLPRHVWPLSSGACSSGKGVDFSCLAVLLLGTTPPWTLHIQPQQCGSKVDSQDQENILPAIVGVQAGAGAADSVRVAWSGTGSASSGAVQLWDGVAPLGQLLLVSDPRCAYALRLRWDLGGWLGLSLRHLLFVLPILCMALSQARLSPMAGSTARVAVVSAVVAAWGSLHPDMLASVGGGMRPWVQLSVVEALSALLLAGGGVALVDGLLSISLRLLQWALPLKHPKQARLSSLACLAVVVASSLLHPAAPAYLGCCCLAVQLAARQQASASLAARGGAEDGAAVAADGARGPSIPLAWLMFYTQLALLPTVGLVGWLVSGMQHAAEWTDGRVLVAALALHACLVGCARARPTGGAVQERPPQPPKHIELASLAAAAAHEAAACLTAAASLWGHPYFALYAASGSAALDALALALAAAGKLS